MQGWVRSQETLFVVGVGRYLTSSAALVDTAPVYVYELESFMEE